ncbi:putative membrane protein hemolysin III [Lachnospiraceae bacterium TWA4]|nr:putative membrane protein hemolysin III [Lachnospiraceae bacterium TWA4]
MKITIREPGNALTHLIACIMALIGMAPLLIKASSNHHIFAMSIFACSMIALYAASTIYHSVVVPDKQLKIFKKIDHFMIFILIAGSYTPICLITLPKPMGYYLLAIVWSVALIGILIKAFWIMCPKWFSSIIYIAMGWLCVLVFGSLWNELPLAAFNWLLVGGIIYTVGGIIYALKLPLFNSIHKSFGSHAIFHLFVMGGSFCHYIFMYNYIA